MALIGRDYIQFAEVLVNIFTVDKGTLKVLLLKKKIEPYKGYWCLPSNLLKEDQILDDAVSNCIYDKAGIDNLFTIQDHVFSTIDRVEGNRVLGISYIGLVDSVALLLHQEQRDYELEWFSISTLPKLAYDHNAVVNNAIDFLKKQLVNTSMLKHLFPADFTLPELQKVYEQLLNITIDRRNFRKKFLNLDLIEDTLDYSTGVSGRPAKLYRFKDNIKDISIF